MIQRQTAATVSFRLSLHLHWKGFDCPGVRGELGLFFSDVCCRLQLPVCSAPFGPCSLPTLPGFAICCVECDVYPTAMQQRS
jgi:hypothetical protein